MVTTELGILSLQPGTLAPGKSVLQFTQFMGNSEAQGTHHFVDAPLFPVQLTQSEACN